MQERAIENLYENLLLNWNNQDANGMASLFTRNGTAIGFDGSQMKGREQIETEIRKVFENHKTARYVWKVEEMRTLNESVALLRSFVGMIPPGKSEVQPDRNAIQTIVAIFENEVWKIALFQNTPAQFHGRPELVKKMTDELNSLIK